MFPTLYDVATVIALPKKTLILVIALPKKILILLRKHVRMGLSMATLFASLVALCKGVARDGHELVDPALRSRWAHVQPRAKCLSGQANLTLT